MSFPVTAGFQYENKYVEVLSTFRTDEMKVCQPKVIYRTVKKGLIARREKIMIVHRIYDAMFDTYRTEIIPIE